MNRISTCAYLCVQVHIKDCVHNDWGVTDCEHHEDAAVLCHTERIPGKYSKIVLGED